MKQVLGLSALAGVAMACFGAQAAPVPVDLSSWQEDGTGNWIVQAGNDSVLQTVNTSTPAVFYAPGTNAQGTALSGKITVSTATTDDDFIGFVLGYQTGEVTSSSADFILVDWKAGNQTNVGQFGAAGLAISHVTNGSSAISYWGHTGGIDEIERATNLGSTGWQEGVEYDFDIVFNPNLIQVFVNGSLELNTTAAEAGLASFGNGAFGFYNYSQDRVLYSALEEREAPPNEAPVPATMLLLIPGIAGIVAARRNKRRA